MKHKYYLTQTEDEHFQMFLMGPIEKAEEERIEHIEDHLESIKFYRRHV